MLLAVVVDSLQTATLAVSRQTNNIPFHSAENCSAQIKLVIFTLFVGTTVDLMYVSAKNTTYTVRNNVLNIHCVRVKKVPLAENMALGN